MYRGKISNNLFLHQGHNPVRGYEFKLSRRLLKWVLNYFYCLISEWSHKEWFTSRDHNFKKIVLRDVGE